MSRRSTGSPRSTAVRRRYCSSSISLAVLVLVGAALAQFVAWLGAVMNTSRLEDKTWFVILLVTGLLSFGFIAMIVYVVAGPDGTRPVLDRAGEEHRATDRPGEVHSGAAPSPR